MRTGPQAKPQPNRAKRMECVQLAGAFLPTSAEKREQAPRTLPQGGTSRLPESADVLSVSGHVAPPRSLKILGSTVHLVDVHYVMGKMREWVEA